MKMKDFDTFIQRCLKLWTNSAKYFLPQALKNRQKCNKSPNLVKLGETSDNHTDNVGA